MQGDDDRASWQDTFLQGVRVLEVGDEKGEYCGKVLAGLGADVIRVEPPEGDITRTYGPFVGDVADPDRSLHFWHYNFGKRGVRLDLDRADDREVFRQLALRSDVVIDTRPSGYLEARGLDYTTLARDNASIILARLSPFGDIGPWGGFKGSDLIHLALGGVVMNCGYDPEPSGFYETPPVAPQMWQAYQIAGEMTAIAVIGALMYRLETGGGQFLHTPIHEAVSKQTEADMPNWIYSRVRHRRLTCRHSRPDPGNSNTLAATKDGRWILPYQTYLSTGDKTFAGTVEILDRFGSAEDLVDEAFQSVEFRRLPMVQRHIGDIVNRFVKSFLFERNIWEWFQEIGATWAPVRRPEENLSDSHWRARESFIATKRDFASGPVTEIGAKWYCPEVPWRQGPVAPNLADDPTPVIEEVMTEKPHFVQGEHRYRPAISRRGKPFALGGVRIIDLTWILASGGAGRFLAAMGAEVIKVEHESRWDSIRFGNNGVVPPGGRAERERMSDVLTIDPENAPKSPNRSGFFMEVNSGKRSISLNLKLPQGRELLARLVEGANVIIEGFSPGTMERMGFGYERLREINPRIVYVQQSGMGQRGTYGALRSYGPVAAAFSGLSEMSGLPEPYPPAGIGYAYLDWMGAYNMALAIGAALYRQRRTGKGCWIDSSQVETGFYLQGTSVLDYSVNGRSWRRYGNASPHKLAAPHGVYRVAGDDRWIAIGCFSEEEWRSLVAVLGDPDWATLPPFNSMSGRLAHQAELDHYVEAVTRELDGWDLMDRLQTAGVPAGVCQTAEDRYDRDPQLAYLDWLVELHQSEIGTWPVKEFPVSFSKTPPYMGGTVDRHGPNYGEDNDYVYRELLGLSDADIEELGREHVI
jgi:crotonobetainyl-CoA:carnitine CoA-transferase CaiB-like acyl-CoA transferase